MSRVRRDQVRVSGDWNFKESNRLVFRVLCFVAMHQQCSIQYFQTRQIF